MQRSDEPLTKVTINLYARDITTLRNRYGWGWSEIVRQWVRQQLRRELNAERD